MTRIIVLAFAALAACSSVPPAAVPVPVVERPMDTPAAFDLGEVQRDLETGARAKYGEAAVARAFAAPTSIIAKHYFGLAPPPVLQPDGSYKEREPPLALLVRENGAWMAATGSGWRKVDAAKALALETALRDAAFWAEPDYARPGCTDAGASRLVLRFPGKPVTVRQGACGATARTEKLIFAALDA
ncbi:MAG: hypothetical protein M3Q57_10115 [Pseudomonadota bacterium]|nr:hypothetical protein [Pseudomonadota bacterium]